RAMAVVAHHPIVIHFEGIALSLLIVNIVTVSTLFKSVAFVYLNRPCIERYRSAVELYRPSLFGNDNRSHIIHIPRKGTLVRKNLIVESLLRRDILLNRLHIGPSRDGFRLIMRHGENVLRVRLPHPFNPHIEKCLRIQVGTVCFHVKGGLTTRWQRFRLSVYISNRIANGKCVTANGNTAYKIVFTFIDRKRT